MPLAVLLIASYAIGALVFLSLACAFRSPLISMPSVPSLRLLFIPMPMLNLDSQRLCFVVYLTAYCKSVPCITMPIAVPFHPVHFHCSHCVTLPCYSYCLAWPT